MKRYFKRLVSIVATICLCATLVPGSVAASIPAAEKLNMSIGLISRSDDNYDVNYTVKLVVSEQYAKIVALNKADTAFLKELRFTCILKDALVEQMTNPSQDDFTFSGEGSANFDFISVEKKNGDEIHIAYKLNETVVDSWKAMKTADVKDALKKAMVMASTKTVTDAQLDEAEENGVLLTTGEVQISSADGKIPYFNEKNIVAAKGSAIARRTVADPSETGIDDYLITGEHIVYMVGDDKGNFRPNDSVTRAEVAQVFYALLKDKDVKITAKFDDVEDSAWYSKAINTLASLGRLSGVGDNKFEPNRAITRAEFAIVATGFAKGVEAEIEFSDVAEEHWAYRGVTIAAMYGWVSGIGDNEFAPNRPITRAEVATILNHMLGRMADKDAVDAGAGTQFPDVTKSHWAWYEIAEATTTHNYEQNADRTRETWKK